jgi:hypothetical protein
VRRIDPEWSSFGVAVPVGNDRCPVGRVDKNCCAVEMA